MKRLSLFFALLFTAVTLLADSVTPTATLELVADSPNTGTDGGQLTAMNPDGPDDSFRPVSSGSATYGSFTVSATGVWTYTPANDLPIGNAVAADTHPRGHSPVRPTHDHRDPRPASPDARPAPRRARSVPVPGETLVAQSTVALMARLGGAGAAD